MTAQGSPWHPMRGHRHHFDTFLASCGINFYLGGFFWGVASCGDPSQGRGQLVVGSCPGVRMVGSVVAERVFERLREGRDTAHVHRPAGSGADLNCEPTNPQSPQEEKSINIHGSNLEPSKRHIIPIFFSMTTAPTAPCTSETNVKLIHVPENGAASRTRPGQNVPLWLGVSGPFPGIVIKLYRKRSPVARGFENSSICATPRLGV